MQKRQYPHTRVEILPFCVAFGCVCSLAKFGIFSMKIPYPSVGFVTHNQEEPSRQAFLSASERRLLRGGSSEDEQSASHQAGALTPQRSITCVTAPISLPF